MMNRDIDDVINSIDKVVNFYKL